MGAQYHTPQYQPITQESWQYLGEYHVSEGGLRASNEVGEYYQDLLFKVFCPYSLMLEGPFICLHFRPIL